MQLVGEMPSIPAAVLASKSSTTRSTITSRSPADSSRDRGLELGREAFEQPLLVALGHRGDLLAARAALLGAEVVERRRPRDLAEPGAGRAALRVEPVPEPERPLERLAGQILGREPVAGEPDEVGVDVVEVALGGFARSWSRRPYAAGSPSHVTTLLTSSGRGSPRTFSS